MELYGWMDMDVCPPVWLFLYVSACMAWIIEGRCVRTTVNNIRTIQQKTGGREELKPKRGQTNGKTQLATSEFAWPEAAAVCLCIWLIAIMDKHGDQMIKTYQSRAISLWYRVTARGHQKLSPSSGGQMPWCWATSVEACGSSFAVRQRKRDSIGRARS